MNKLKTYYRLARPFNALSGALAVFSVAMSLEPAPGIKVALAAVVTLLVTASSNAFNDYLDVKLTASTSLATSFAVRSIDAAQCSVVFNVTALLSVVVAAFINLPSFVIAILANGLLYIYSWKLKSTVLVGNLIVADVSFECGNGGVAAGNAQPTLVSGAGCVCHDTGA